MKNTSFLAAAIAVGATGAFAGGIDRTGQSINVIFEDGDYVELSYGTVMPNVSGTALAIYGSAASGNMAPSYSQFGGAAKTDLSNKLSAAVIFEQPFGANVDYSSAAYVAGGSYAEVNTTSITVLGKYQATDRISVYAGPRFITASGIYTAAIFGTTQYTSTYSQDSDIGFVAGAAYEIPDIALRAALTYSSQTEFSMDGTVGDLTATMPQSVNLDLQSGIAANTLAFVNIRWADWSEATIDDSLAGNLTDFGNTDAVTFTAGIGRKFSDNFSARASIGYEASTGDESGNLAPTDGYYSIGLAGSYELENGAKISGGVKYVMIGDTFTPVGTFADNSAFGFGLKLSKSF